MRADVPLIICLVLALAWQAFAADKFTNTDCFDCHLDPTTTRKVDGKVVALIFPTNSFDKSLHAKLDCIDCHEGIKTSCRVNAEREEAVAHNAAGGVGRVAQQRWYPLGLFSGKLIRCGAAHRRRQRGRNIAMATWGAAFIMAIFGCVGLQELGPALAARVTASARAHA